MQHETAIMPVLAAAPARAAAQLESLCVAHRVCERSLCYAVAYPSLFDRHPLSGRTYVTRHGAVLPNELHYFDGEMLHVYGECTNLAAVDAALGGSGYRAVRFTSDDKRETAAAQVWINRFSHCTIGPYSAMFIVVAAVPIAASSDTYLADATGASSVLPMLDGRFDAASGIYRNRSRIFLVRLLDTTDAAIDVGRERMGTDKRPASIDFSRDDQQIRIAVGDADNRRVVDILLPIASRDTGTYAAALNDAARRNRVDLPQLPIGVEYVYPAVARIGRRPVVEWEWRTDVVPRLQPFDGKKSGSRFSAGPGSEEGRILLTWGFEPRAAGYVAHVRGLITGLADAPDLSGPPAVDTAAPPTVSHSTVSRGGRGEPAPILQECEAATAPLTTLALASSQMPGAGIGPATESQSHSPSAEPARVPQWTWRTRFLGTLSARLRKERVGVTPDGLRINWHVIDGTFIGPGFDAIVLPGAADWMRIRRDGVALVDVQACFKTRDGELVNGAYGGIFDLGPDGFDRAVRDEFDVLPPVVVTPTYATSAPALQWLNRAQCMGVGRVDMAAFRVEFDVYVVDVGGRAEATGNAAAPTGVVSLSPSPASLFDRLGGLPVVHRLTNDFVAAVLADPQLARFFPAGPVQSNLRDRVVELLCHLTGGPCAYTGRDMTTAHRGMGITMSDWRLAVDIFVSSLRKNGVGTREHTEFVAIIESMRDQIVEVRTP